MSRNYNYKKEFTRYKEDITNKKYEVCDEQINYFYSYYKKEKNDNPNFNIDIEKSRLLFKINDQISNILIFYFGIIISMLFYEISNCDNQMIRLGIISIAVISFFTIYKIMLLNEESDMFHRALMALEKIEKEEEEEGTNKSQEQQMEEVKRIKEFLNIK